MKIVELSYKHTIGAGITINISRAVGVNVRRMKGADDKWYLCAIGWYPVSRKLLSHYRLSCRSF